MADQPDVRIEDGSIQFGSDWPGVFFRGDTAFNFGGHLGAALQHIERGEPVDGIAMAVLRGLHSELLSASTEAGKETRQFLKPAQECRLEPGEGSMDVRTLESLRALARKAVEAQNRQPEETLQVWANRLALAITNGED